ncbi:MAG: LysE family translocator [Actinobacteria bacterium]|nr:LysE family translocator [Actinomycetota bacterium]
MIDDRLLAWIGVAVVLVILPGPDTTMVLRSGLRGGRAAALGAAYGINTGLVVWTAASALGVAALLEASATAFTVLKVAGALYLAYVGIRMLVLSFRTRGTLVALAPERRALSVRAAYRSGLMTNLLNPKIAATFTTLLPQFVAKDDPAVARSALLAGVFLVLGIVYLTILAIAVGKAADLIQRPRVRAWIERLTGVVFLAFSVQLAFQRR